MLNVVPCPFFAVDVDGAFMIFYDAVHGANPEPCAAPHLFCCEEGLKNSLCVFGSMLSPYPVTDICTYFPAVTFSLFRIDFVKDDILCFKRKALRRPAWLPGIDI